jgi:hypothetical protein
MLGRVVIVPSSLLEKLEIQFGFRIHMLTLSKKHILECQKKLSKIFGFIYPQSKCVCKVSLETDNFYGVRKKRQQLSCEIPYF